LGFGFFWDSGKKKGVYEYINIIGFDLELLRKKAGPGRFGKTQKKKNTERKKEKKKRKKEKK
jgi:hypothetical protein